MKEILTCSHVDICYNGKKVVSDVSFSLREHEILGIVGESGSGKSTLIKAVMGMLGPDGMVTRGDIIYDGKDLPDLPDKELRRICGRRIGMIFQNAGASFCPVRKIGAQMFEAYTAHEATGRAAFAEKAKAMLKAVGFSDPQRVLESYPFELSGGMQQRVGIASAMLLSPQILLADEPTSALDAHIQKQVVQTMLDVRKHFGTAIVMVTHNIAVVEAMADRVLVMKDGRVVEYGETGTVLGSPTDPYTKKLMAAVPRLRSEE